jgi:hypothetical protein
MTAPLFRFISLISALDGPALCCLHDQRMLISTVNTTRGDVRQDLFMMRNGVCWVMVIGYMNLHQTAVREGIGDQGLGIRRAINHSSGSIAV